MRGLWEATPQGTLNQQEEGKSPTIPPNKPLAGNYNRFCLGSRLACLCIVNGGTFKELATFAALPPHSRWRTRGLLGENSNRE